MAAKAWFCDDGSVYKGKEPNYYDTSKYDWVKILENNWSVIHDELKKNIARTGAELTPYIDGEMTNTSGKWKTLGLMFWFRKSNKYCNSFPQTWKIVQAIPNLAGVSFNLLEAGTTIKPHIGNTNAIIRCHLGLNIPAAAPTCGFRVGNEVRSWQDGKLLMFCDAYEHTAWNNSSDDRYIMVIDIVREEYSEERFSIAGRVLAYMYIEVEMCRSRIRSALSFMHLDRLFFILVSKYYAMNILICHRD